MTKYENQVLHFEKVTIPIPPEAIQQFRDQMKIDITVYHQQYNSAGIYALAMSNDTFLACFMIAGSYCVGEAKDKQHITDYVRNECQIYMDQQLTEYNKIRQDTKTKLYCVYKLDTLYINEMFIKLEKQYLDEHRNYIKQYQNKYPKELYQRFMDNDTYLACHIVFMNSQVSREVKLLCKKYLES